MSNLKNLILPKGKVVKINGIPFKLVHRTIVKGTEKNLKLALELDKDQAGK